MMAVVIDEVYIYILCHQNNIYQYIVTHLILEIFLASERRTGAWVTLWLWEKGVLCLGIVEMRI